MTLMARRGEQRIEAASAAETEGADLDIDLLWIEPAALARIARALCFLAAAEGGFAADTSGCGAASGRTTI